MYPPTQQHLFYCLPPVRAHHVKTRKAGFVCCTSRQSEVWICSLDSKALCLLSNDTRPCQKDVAFVITSRRIVVMVSTHRKAIIRKTLYLITAEFLNKNENEATIKVRFQASYLLAQQAKPFPKSELMKTRLIAAAEEGRPQNTKLFKGLAILQE